MSAGWDNARAANELGLHPTVIWKYTTGKTTPSITVLRLMAGLTSQPLNLPGESILRFNDGPRWLEEWEGDVIAVLRRIEPTARKRVIHAITEMIDAIARGGPSYIRRPAGRKHPGQPLPTTESLAAEIGADFIASTNARRPSAGAAPDAGGPPRSSAGASAGAGPAAPDRKGIRRATGGTVA